MFDWMRKFPHRKIGQCGGARADCSWMGEKEAAALNWLQRAFWKHDVSLSKAQTLIERAKGMKKAADEELARDLRAGDPDELPVRERFGLMKAKLVFR